MFSGGCLDRRLHRLPLSDARGDAVEHLRSWTHAQTHPWDRYQVVIASERGRHPPEVNRERTDNRELAIAVRRIALQPS
ncbi:MAG TPA: hypothetical protein VHR38_06785 [Solirubrobacterales bacterium]|jgi:hypothetical protein|nr:hypothetical protein [Solirubrobacterales bacterium]